ncbi:DUF3304 domain-containing protein [Escherichia coli]|uniref:DUF3304 domain-containing protein n=2 Tax=Enterobacteriaceae TaxID=543 RepID=UPI000578F677|nr:MULTISPECIES: DUF3304 domain-containing protein [Escherichia]EHQ5529530.1 DUF3304 domain-containing protein [Escherichia coli O2]EGO6620603.1 DUF3304 domain-containing protein [Escherichia coli]EGP5936127.1 DUF3304 domain-containing protein [Escherichia coli]EGP5940403.1 DUF3304 domain-containing protein [Escherichia coli]EGP6255165.1 DUF3304 domain-containing protein [Escherichia coli]
MRAIFKCYSLMILFVLSGCSMAKNSGDYTAGDIKGMNHTDVAINYFSINGYGGPNIVPFGERGGYCCIMLPDKWRVGLMARIEWEVDPNPLEPIAMKKEGFGYEEDAYAKHAANYQKYKVIVDIPEYGAERCGMTVHFLPCNQIKVTTVCQGYGTPNYPIKEPREMKEPATCPAK